MGLYGSAPESPDPTETANAQFNYDTGASLASGIINNPNTYDPYGSTTYSQAGMETITLPNGQTVKVPRYNKTTALTPQGQHILNQQQNLAGKTYGQLSGMMGRSSTAGVNPWTTGYNVGNLKTGFRGDANTSGFYTPGIVGNVDLKHRAGTQSYNDLNKQARDVQTGYTNPGQFNESRKRVEQATMSRGNQLLQESRNSENARLAAMGLSPGTAAYGRVANQFEQSANDLAMQAVLAGGQEQSRLLGEARSAGEFHNNATGQRFNQMFGVRDSENARRMAETGLYNTAQQGEFDMRTSLKQMENARRTGDMQAYNQALEAYNNAQIAGTQMRADRAAFGNNVRSGQVGERESLKSNELNRLIGLLTGGQVTSPTIPGYNSQGVQAPDYSGLVQDDYQTQTEAYNNRMSAISGLIGGAFGLF